MALAVSVALSAVVIGAVLSTALLIGPAATRAAGDQGPGPGRGRGGWASGWRLPWLGILLAYDSYYWPPAGRGWPVSFFVVTLVVGGYLVTYLRRPVTAAEPAPRRGARMFGPLMINTWIAATAVAVIAGVTGFFAVLRGSTFAAHAIPNGAFAGAAGASLLGLNPFAGLAVFSLAGALVSPGSAAVPGTTWLPR